MAWQITLAELNQESFQPMRKIVHPGTYHFTCPICKEVVGIYRDPNFDKATNGMMYKRDECKNGHRVDWSIYEEVDKDV